MTTEELIARYCIRLGISRHQYDAEPVLARETIDALLELHGSNVDDPTIPAGLPGAEKRRSELTDVEANLLSMCEVALADLLASLPP